MRPIQPKIAAVTIAAVLGVIGLSQHALWSSRTSSPGAYVLVQNDGNVVVYSTAAKPLWSSGTAGR